MDLEKIKENTLNHFKNSGMDLNDLGYITEDLVTRMKTAKSGEHLKDAPKMPEGGEFTNYQGINKAADQWSGYVFNIYVDENNIFHYETPCPVPSAYYVPYSQVVSCDQNGICGNFSQYYVVINI